MWPAILSLYTEAFLPSFFFLPHGSTGKYYINPNFHSFQAITFTVVMDTYINDVHGGGEHMSLYKAGKLLIHLNSNDPILVSSLQIQNSANPQEVFANPSSLMSSVMLFSAEVMCLLICPPYVTAQPF